VAIGASPSPYTPSALLPRAKRRRQRRWQRQDIALAVGEERRARHGGLVAFMGRTFFVKKNGIRPSTTIEEGS